MTVRRPDREYLEVDFLASDKDDGGLRNVIVKIVTTRKPHQCLVFHRGHEIPVGARARFEKGIYEGKWGSWYGCLECIDQWLDYLEGKVDDLPELELR